MCIPKTRENGQGVGLERDSQLGSGQVELTPSNDPHRFPRHRVFRLQSAELLADTAEKIRGHCEPILAQIPFVQVRKARNLGIAFLNLLIRLAANETV
jgi:hypothetical protein